MENSISIASSICEIKAVEKLGAVGHEFLLLHFFGALFFFLLFDLDLLLGCFEILTWTLRREGLRCSFVCKNTHNPSSDCLVLGNPGSGCKLASSFIHFGMGVLSPNIHAVQHLLGVQRVLPENGMKCHSKEILVTMEKWCDWHGLTYTQPVSLQELHVSAKHIAGIWILNHAATPRNSTYDHGQPHMEEWRSVHLGLESPVGVAHLSEFSPPSLEATAHRRFSPTHPKAFWSSCFHASSWKTWSKITDIKGTGWGNNGVFLILEVKPNLRGWLLVPCLHSHIRQGAVQHEAL